MSRPNGDSVWGNINTCIEIGLNVYEIMAEHGEGIMVEKGKDTLLSEKALSLGKEEGDYITFEEHQKEIPRYEVLKAQLEENKLLEAKLLEEIKDIERNGQYYHPEYFGEIARLEDVTTPVCRGIGMIAGEHGTQLAIHRTVAEDYMSEMAETSGELQGEYRYYDLKTACIPIFELAKVFPEVEALVIEKESLYASLHSDFTAYVEEYKELAPSDPIPMAYAPTHLYLAQQLKERQSQPVESTQEEYVPYGEELEHYDLERFR